MSENPISEEIHLRVLRLLAANPEISQRELAELLGVSLGKTNYCLKALLSTGSIKMRNFRNSSNKSAYAYCLTPKGIRTKAGLTRAFLNRKTAEYEALRREIELLRQEDGAATSPPTM